MHTQKGRLSSLGPFAFLTLTLPCPGGSLACWYTRESVERSDLAACSQARVWTQKTLNSQGLTLPSMEIGSKARGFGSHFKMRLCRINSLWWHFSKIITSVVYWHREYCIFYVIIFYIFFLSSFTATKTITTINPLPYSSGHPVRATVVAGNIKHKTSCGDFYCPTWHQILEQQSKCFYELDIGGITAVLNQLARESRIQ